MVTTAPGKTVQVYIPKQHKRDVEVWIKNFRRAREILERISTANRKLLRQGRLFQGGQHVDAANGCAKDRAISYP